ncbi:MAG: type VI secretion system tube protein TssD [Dehalococcoidia bacterium]
MHTYSFWQRFSLARLLVVAAIAIAALGGAGLAWTAAQAQTADEQVHACVSSSGNVRIVESGDSCRRNETPVSWNTQGSAGTPGEDGAPGPQGETGETEVTVNVVNDPPEPAAAVDYYLKIDGIDGESRDSGHEGEIDVFSWSWGASHSGATHTGGGGAGKANFQDITVTKHVDKATPKLMEAIATGKHIPEVVLTVRDTDGDGRADAYLVITMKNVLVSSVSTGGEGDREVPSETLSLNYEEIKVTYSEADGSTTEFSWNVATNAPGS